VVAEKLPFFAVSVLFGMLTISTQQAEGISEFEKYTIVQRIMFASYGFVMYLVKMVVPTGLSVMHPYPKIEDGLPAAYAISTLVAVGLGVLTFLSYKRTKVVIFGMLFYLFSLILVLQFMSVGRAIIAERYTYLAYIGPFILIGYAFNRIINDKTGKMTKYKTVAQGVLILYGGAMTFTCFERTKIWKNPETMWTDVIAKYPDDWFAYMGRANWYIDNNDYQKSFADYNKIVSLKPDKADAYVGRGNVFRRNNQLPEALKDYNKAISLDSSKASGFNDRGSVYFDLGQDELALRDFNRALSMKPDLYQTYNNMGSVYARKGDYETALKNYGKALEINPRYADSYLNRAILFTLNKESAAAQKDFDTYFGIIKDKAVHKAYYWNGVNEQNQQQYAKAISSLTNAITLSPISGSYYFTRSECYLANRDKPNALKDALKAKELGVNVTEEYLGRLK
jgi:tetratricopeptide (TPR) repeat protein